jgi:hypothetical protein
MWDRTVTVGSAGSKNTLYLTCPPRGLQALSLSDIFLQSPLLLLDGELVGSLAQSRSFSQL